MRKLAKQLRIFFGCRNKYYFDVIKVFENVNILLPQITTEIVEDDSFDEDIPSRCIPDFHGHFLIQVKERIYNGAIKGCGAHRMHILHEICHVILFEAGFFPFYG